jgi:hypothetical protein
VITLGYRPPELQNLTRDQLERGVDAYEQSDIWSLGITLLDLLEGKIYPDYLPDDDTQEEVMKEWQISTFSNPNTYIKPFMKSLLDRKHIDTTTHQGLSNLLISMLSIKPSYRSNTDELLRSSLLKKHILSGSFHPRELGSSNHAGDLDFYHLQKFFSEKEIQIQSNGWEDIDINYGTKMGYNILITWYDNKNFTMLITFAVIYLNVLSVYNKTDININDLVGISLILTHKTHLDDGHRVLLTEFFNIIPQPDEESDGDPVFDSLRAIDLELKTLERVNGNYFPVDPSLIFRSLKHGIAFILVFLDIKSFFDIKWNRVEDDYPFDKAFSIGDITIEDISDNILYE